MNRLSHPPDVSAPKEAGTAAARRHDLDALRAAAMLLGIAYHCALSFSLGAGWVVRDEKQSKLLYVFQAFVHGFRMPLFMLLSGFFTAMLWRKRGFKSMLASRYRRVVLPCLAGLCTVVPAIHWAETFALKLQAAAARTDLPNLEFSGSNHFAAPDGFSNGPWRSGGNSKKGFQGNAQPGGGGPVWKAWAGWLRGPVFVLLWFLWFLVWLLPFFSIYAAFAERLKWKLRPHPLLASEWSLVWLLPLTLFPALRMGVGRSDFGPETSLGVIPLPHVLAYYGVFFGFGVLYFEHGGFGGRLGRCWTRTLPLTLLVVFPLALDFASGTFGIRQRVLPGGQYRPLSVLFQVLYAWLMSFACIGLFRAFVRRENRLVRYLMDASYWCYLAHLPFVILAQALVSRWDLPAMLKFSAVFCTVSGLMLLSYAKLVRHRCIGKFLNGGLASTGAPVRET